MNKKKQKGFTLLEMLIVVAIIGLLASIVLVAVRQSRLKARDARRKQSINTLLTAIESYSIDHSAYPTPIIEFAGAWEYSSDGDFMPILLTQNYISSYFLDTIRSLNSYYTIDPTAIANSGCSSSTKAVLHFYLESPGYNTFQSCWTQGPDYWGYCRCLG